MPEEKFHSELEAAANLTFKPEQIDIEGVPHLLLGAQQKLQSLEHLLDHPRVIEEKPHFNDMDGFCFYVNRFKGDHSLIFVDDSNFQFHAVLDFHSPEQPDWCRHSCTYQARMSPEWKNFQNINGDYISKQRFVRFLENNIDYIVGDYSGADLLSMCKNIKAHMTRGCEVSEDLGDKDRKLTVSKSLAGEVKNEVFVFPEELEVSLRVFKNTPAYKGTLRLRWDFEDANEPEFMIDFKDPEGFAEAAFDKLIEALKGQTDLEFVKGSLN